MEYLKDIGLVGFLFFLIKGIMWLVLFGLVYFGVIDKQRMIRIKSKMAFWKQKRPRKKSLS